MHRHGCRKISFTAEILSSGIVNGSKVTGSLWYKLNTATCPYKCLCDQKCSTPLRNTPSFSPLGSALFERNSTLCTGPTCVLSTLLLQIPVTEKKQFYQSNCGDSPAYQVPPLWSLGVFVELSGHNIQGCCIQKLELFGLLVETNIKSGSCAFSEDERQIRRDQVGGRRFLFTRKY